MRGLFRDLGGVRKSEVGKEKRGKLMGVRVSEDVCRVVEESGD